MSHVDEDHGKFLKRERGSPVVDEIVHGSIGHGMIEILESSYSSVKYVVSFEN
jgi:hypothetical protein